MFIVEEISFIELNLVSNQQGSVFIGK